MKIVAYLILCLLFFIVLLPLIIIKGCNLSTSYDEEKNENTETMRVSVYNHETETLMNLGFEEYLKGVVAAEMPASFELEALKAQAVAARTYAIRRHLEYDGNGCGKEKDADICTDPAHCQAWVSKKDLIKRWGEQNFQENWDKITNSVKKTEGLILKFNGKVIDPVYHSTSGGRTENSEDVWGNEIPYLRSVVSQYEEHSPRYKESYAFNVYDFVKTLKNEYPPMNLNPSNVMDDIKIINRSKSGSVIDIEIGGVAIKGTEIRNLFKLNSTNFQLKFEGNNLRITTTGYGHGVGMSQYGADGLAKQGKSFIEILEHYYSGVETSNIN